MDNLQPSRINGGNSSTGRKASDFYPTPPEATVALLKFLSLPAQAHIWEPACGEGHMVDVMEAMGYEVTGTDIQAGDDFLTIPLMGCDWIITNPPFRLAEQFIRQCAKHNSGPVVCPKNGRESIAFRLTCPAEKANARKNVSGLCHRRAEIHYRKHSKICRRKLHEDPVS